MAELKSDDKNENNKKSFPAAALSSDKGRGRDGDWGTYVSSSMKGQDDA